MTNLNSIGVLDRLALGSKCPRCKAGTDEDCRTPLGYPTIPHKARIDRAVAQYVKNRDAK